ncbi:NAD(+)/NADH kinase [Salarchaeum japonicum]|uniref:NAD(+)/NADH kinase n=1 Tax=Salarchaeum japonicum TaxID=555573 RepID=A0AAV3SX33_9EURY|nr:ATP-NAD kinase [Salarchaeum japonicum]
MTGLSDVETVGVRGERADALAAFVAEHDRDPVTGDPGAVADADLVVADGEAALYDLVRAGADAPVLVLGDVPGIPSARWERHANAMTHAFVGNAGVHATPLLSVRADGETYRALADAMVVTDEPARISEYGVHAANETVDTVRADGVTVATAAGSRGYGSAADGPVVAPGVDAVSVVPVAPFRVDQSNWVLPLPTDLTVERETADVVLLVDDREVATLDHDATVRIDHGGTLPVVTTPETTGFFD